MAHIKGGLRSVDWNRLMVKIIPIHIKIHTECAPSDIGMGNQMFNHKRLSRLGTFTSNNKYGLSFFPKTQYKTKYFTHLEQKL